MRPLIWRITTQSGSRSQPLGTITSKNQLKRHHELWAEPKSFEVWQIDSRLTNRIKAGGRTDQSEARAASSPLRIIKSTPACWWKCLEFAIKPRTPRDDNLGQLRNFQRPSKHAPARKIIMKYTSNFARKTQELTLEWLFESGAASSFDNGGEISHHPHKETLLARLLTRTHTHTQQNKKVLAEDINATKLCTSRAKVLRSRENFFFSLLAWKWCAWGKRL